MSIRILAIEDEPIYAESLRMVIEELNYILIDVVDQLDEFKRLVKATVPDILLVDIDLRADIDGIELVSQINEEESRIPVIFLTASKDTETILRAKTTGPSAYIPKPYESSALQAAIEIAILDNKSRDTNISTSSASENFFVKSEGVLKKVHFADVLYIEVKEKFCHIHTTQGQLEVKIRLKDLIERLPSDQIVQIHRSFAVMVNAIDAVDTALNSLSIGELKLPIGKNYKDEVAILLNRLG